MNDGQRAPSFREWNGVNPYHTLLGVQMEERGGGYARLRVPFVERLGGGVAGSFHGGIVSGLIDYAAVNAAVSALSPEESAAGTAELNVSYLRPALGAYIVAEARVLKKGRTLAVVDVDVTNPEGKLVAKGRVTYAVRPAALTRDGRTSE